MNYGTRVHWLVLDNSNQVKVASILCLEKESTKCEQVWHDALPIHECLRPDAEPNIRIKLKQQVVVLIIVNKLN